MHNTHAPLELRLMLLLLFFVIRLFRGEGREEEESEWILLFVLFAVRGCRWLGLRTRQPDGASDSNSAENAKRGSGEKRRLAGLLPVLPWPRCARSAQRARRTDTTVVQQLLPSVAFVGPGSKTAAFDKTDTAPRPE